MQSIDVRVSQIVWNGDGSNHGFGMTDLWLVTTAIIWGVNYSVVKVGLEYLSPLTFNAMRMTIATAVLAMVAAFMNETRWPSRRERWQLLLLGVLGNGVYQLFFIFGISRTRAGIAALIVAATPAWTAIISQIMRHERINGAAWTGISLQLLGVASVVGSTRGFQGSGAMLGAMLMAAGSVCWAAFTVLMQPLTLRFHPMQLSVVTMASGAFVICMAAVPDLLRTDFSVVPAAAWGAVAYASVGALVIGYLLYYHGVRVLGAMRTSMYGNLQPVVAIGVAWIILREQPTGWQWTGTALILGGLLVSRMVRLRPAGPKVTPAWLRRT